MVPMEFPKQDLCCTLCNYQCSTKSLLEEHIRRHTLERPYICDQCNQEFAFKITLNRHVQQVHQRPPKIHKCALCPYETHRKQALEIHIQTHTGERSFPCQQSGCNYAAKSSNEIQKHNIQKHQNVRKFPCKFPNCGYRAKTASALSVHSVIHSEFKRFVCDYKGCNFRTKRKDQLEQHKRGVHSCGYKPYACSKCNYCSASKRNLREHELVHLVDKTVKCNFNGCMYSCVAKKHLKQHVLNNHTDKKFKCNFETCQFAAVSQYKLEVHTKNLHFEKIHKCSSCDYRAAYLWQLGEHQERYHATYRILCPNEGCRFQTRTRALFLHHMRCHKLSLFCQVEGCDHISTSRSTLKRHMRLHDPNGRPFHCPICPQHFTEKAKCLRHLQTHTTEKPFKCPTCNYVAARNECVVNHMRKHHSTALNGFACEDKFICNHCSVNFGSAIGLAMHTIKLKTAVVVITRLQLKY